jgi:NAD(P)-dependent dehydrogenase (short-subunit alcohol dehydrogenase family)
MQEEVSPAVPINVPVINTYTADYSASKAAVLSLIQTSTWQLAGSSVRCNAILPGLIETGMTVQMYDMARERGTEGKIGQLNPLRRGGHADEIARMALFLASDESSYVNGQGIAVDGGLSAGLPVALAGGKAKIG